MSRYKASPKPKPDQNPTNPLSLHSSISKKITVAPVWRCLEALGVRLLRFYDVLTRSWISCRTLCGHTCGAERYVLTRWDMRAKGTEGFLIRVSGSRVYDGNGELESDDSSPEFHWDFPDSDGLTTDSDIGTDRAEEGYEGPLRVSSPVQDSVMTQLESPLSL